MNQPSASINPEEQRYPGSDSHYFTTSLALVDHAGRQLEDRRRPFIVASRPAQISSAKGRRSP